MMAVGQYTVALLTLSGLVYLAGYALQRLFLRRRDLADLADLGALARPVLGVGFWIAIAFLLATIGWLKVLPLCGVALAIVVCALWLWRAERGDAANGRCGNEPLRPRSAEAWFGAALIGVLISPFYLLAMGPEVSWDADVYHLALPRLFLERGGFRAVPLSVYSQWPLGTELLFAIAMLAKDYALAKLMHFGFGALTIFALALGCRAFHRGTGAALAALLFLANPVVLNELHVAYVDLAYAFFFTAGFLFALQAARAEARRQDPLTRRAAVGSGLDPRSSWLLSGVCCGVIAGLKVTGVFATLAIGVIALPHLLAAMRNGQLSEPLRRFAGCFVAPVLALWLPWLVKAWLYTGNPIYPLGYSLLGGVDWSAGLALEFTRWQQSIGMGREPLDYLLLPLRVILEGGPEYARFDGAIGRSWLVVLPLAVVFGWRIPLARWALTVSGVYFVIWALSSQQMRFLIPILPLLSMAGAAAIVDLFERFGSQRALWLRLASATGFALFVVALGGDAMKSGVEIATRTRYEVSAKAASAVPGVFRFVEDNLPEDAVLLFINYNRGFFCPREYLADSFFEASQTADWLRPAGTVDELRALLRRRGVSHILFENRRWGIEYPAALRELLRSPTRVERIYQSGGGRLVLFALR